MQDDVHLLDVVASLEDVPASGLVRGQVGTIVEVLGPDSYEVEFTDDDGNTYAVLPLRAEQFMLLRVKPAKVA